MPRLSARSRDGLAGCRGVYLLNREQTSMLREGPGEGRRGERGRRGWAEVCARFAWGGWPFGAAAPRARSLRRIVPREGRVARRREPRELPAGTRAGGSWRAADRKSRD